MVLVGAFVPRQGQAIVDTLGGPLAAFARFAVEERQTDSRFQTW